MKKLLLYLTFLLIPFSLTAQYTPSPYFGTYSGCGLTSTCVSPNFAGGQLKMTVLSMNGYSGVIRVSKCSGSFQSSGTVYIVENNACGNYWGTANYYSGNSYVDVNFSYGGNGTQYIYAATFPDNSNNQRTVSGVISMTWNPISFSGYYVNTNTACANNTTLNFSTTAISGGNGHAVSMYVDFLAPDGITYPTLMTQQSNGTYTLSRTLQQVGNYNYSYRCVQDGFESSTSQLGAITVSSSIYIKMASAIIPNKNPIITGESINVDVSLQNNNACNFSGCVRASLYKSGIFQGIIEEKSTSISGNTTNSYSFYKNQIISPVGTDYDIRVFHSGADGCNINGTGYFLIDQGNYQNPKTVTVSAPTPTITLTEPPINTWGFGQNQTISWAVTNGGCGPYMIEVSTDGGTNWTLIGNNVSGTTYNWAVGKDYLNNPIASMVNNSNLRLKIYCASQTSVNDLSNLFSLAVPSISVTTPPSLIVGQSQNVTWTMNNAVCTTFNVELVTSTGVTPFVLVDNYVTGTSFSWIVPKDKNGVDISSAINNTNNKLKVYCTNYTPINGLSNAFSINPQSVSVTSPATASTYLTGASLPIAWAFTGGYGGNVSIELTQGSTSTTAYRVIIDPTVNDGTESWTIPNDIPAGQYRVKVYNTGSGSIVNYSGVFTINSDPNCPNCLQNVTVANFVQTGNEGFCAAQYLCSLKIIKQDQSIASPTAAILRQDLAKMTLISLLDNPATVDLENNPNAVSFPADNFPVPYNDLSGSAAVCCGSYHRYAKVLSYLDYGDGMPPFVRRASFKPLDNILRIELLQVYLEAYNVDETTASSVILNFNDLPVDLTSQQFLYLKKAVELGLVLNGTATVKIAFRPNVAATREEAFLILKRLRTSTMVTKPSQIVVTNALSYFTPANLTPQNMNIARGIAQGNFSHYSEDGFGIADIGVSLGFGFNYQSFLTEVPDEWKIVEPMGRGWTHGLNAHIFTTITSNDATAKPLLVVSWGDGTFDTYDNTNIPVGFASTDLPSHVSKIGVGNYDILSRPTSTTYTIKKKDQSIITFTSQGEAGLYRMSSVVDKNSNTLSVVYKSGTSVPFKVANKVIDYVQAPSGRKATFTHNSDNYITSIAFPGSTSTTPRNLTFTYNGFELKTFKDARGQVINKSTTYNYGIGLEAYLLKEIILPKGNKVVNGYNANRKLINSRVFGGNGAMTGSTVITHPTIYNTTTTGMDNVSIANVFNPNGLPDSNIGTSANINISRVYDSNHPTKIASFTSSGVTTTSTYFPNGNIDQINYPASIGGYEKFTFDAYNNPLTHRDAKGIITTMIYPDNKNLGSVTKAVGDGTNITQTFTYWANGLPKTSTNNEGIITNFAYNVYGNLNSVNIPILGLTMTANYDYASRKTSVTNFKNQTSTFTYDENDNTKTETDAQNHTTAMAYDDNDNPITITNAKGKVTTLTYDRLDRDSTVTFEGSTQRYFYDDVTNRLTEFRKAGYATDNTRKFIYNYDTYTGLLKSNGYIQNIDYDSKNRMSGIRGGNNASHQLDLFTYDDLNRLQSYRDFYGFTVGYGYDLNANVIRIDYPNGNKLYKTYDNLNRLKTLTWNTTLLITYNYLGSRLDNMVYGNTVKTAMGYDNAGRPNSLNTKNNNGTGSTIFASTYTMDNLGNHLGENEIHPFATVQVPYSSTTTNTFGANNRLNTVTKVTSSGFPTTTETHSYDGDGNVIIKSLSSNMSYDIDDNVTNYTGYGLTMSAIYDALGNRRSVTRNGTETRYVLDINGLANVLAETNASNVVQNYYIHGLGLVARIKADGTIHYYHADFRGSTIAMTNASQAITHKYQYDEFGNQTNIQEADTNPFRYVGAYGIMYETTDLSYIRARYYDPTTGRFNSEDPIWSTNLYPYAGNNGVMNVDLDGLKSEAITESMFCIDAGFILIQGYCYYCRENLDGEKRCYDEFRSGWGTLVLNPSYSFSSYPFANSLDEIESLGTGSSHNLNSLIGSLEVNNEGNIGVSTEGFSINKLNYDSYNDPKVKVSLVRSVEVNIPSYYKVKSDTQYTKTTKANLKKIPISEYTNTQKQYLSQPRNIKRWNPFAN